MAWGGGLFLSLGRPTREQQKACLAEAGGFNYDAALHGATRTTETSGGGDAAPAAALAERGFSVNRWRVQIGSGAGTFLRARSALCSWRHLTLGWADVEAGTLVQVGTKFCICYMEVVIPWVWVMLPLQVAYVESKSVAAFTFGSGTLQGHLLAGEERFSLEVDDEDRVWYEESSDMGLAARDGFEPGTFGCGAFCFSCLGSQSQKEARGDSPTVHGLSRCCPPTAPNPVTPSPTSCGELNGI